MSADHPDPQLLERFMRNQADPPERRKVVRHLLSGCARCGAVTRRLWGLGEVEIALPEAGEEEGSAYGRVLEDLSRRGSRREKQVRSDREAAPRRLAELQELAPGKRRETVASRRRFHTPAFCELLMGESQRPRAGAEWAELAVEVAEHLDVRRFGALLVRSLQTRAWGALGNARRQAGNLDGAETALAAAAKVLSQGADPLDRAELLDYQARLLADQGRFDDAELMLSRALTLYRALEERHLEGRLLLFAAGVRSRREGGGWVRETIARLREGLARLDAEQEPALAASALYRLAGLLAEDRRCEEAQEALGRARALYERLEDAANLARLRLLEGILTETLGSPEGVETAFREALQEALRAGLAREAARALLGLALLYERQGRAADLARLPQELHAIVRVRDAGMSVTMALLFFRRLVETGFAKEDVLVEVARFLGEPPKVRRAGWGF